MTDTDLELEIRATLQAAGESVPVAHGVADRAVRPVRQRRVWLAAGAGVLVMGAVSVALAVLGPTNDDGGVVSTPSPVPSVAQPLPAALIGTWKPVAIAGVDPAVLTPERVQRALWTFQAGGGSYVAGDGCSTTNMVIAGTYRAETDGAISDPNGPVKLPMICDSGAPQVSAVRFAIDGNALTFYGSNGDQVATYEKTASPPVAAALLGRWRPTYLAAEFGNSAYLAGDIPTQASERAAVSFQADGSWRGRDGCNDIRGAYGSNDDGTFVAIAPYSSTEIGCQNIDNVKVLKTAARFTIDGSTLTFHASNGKHLATYQRT
jgi:heat shock protein HslJ